MWKRVFTVAGMLAVAFAAPTSAQTNFLGTLQDAIGTVTGSDSSSSSGDLIGALSNDDIVAGLREALRVGADRVTAQLGAADAFNADPDIHIPLPPALQDVQSTLQTFGLSSLADDVELKLNRAAEKAAPQTKELIWNAITNMTLDDARQIYDGPEDAATQYFKRVSSDDIANAIKPIVDQTLGEVGAIASLDEMMGQYSKLPFAPDVKADLTDHAVQMTLQGLFHYLAREEAAIRQNPAKRTTDLLVRVFGGE